MSSTGVIPHTHPQEATMTVNWIDILGVQGAMDSGAAPYLAVGGRSLLVVQEMGRCSHWSIYADSQERALGLATYGHPGLGPGSAKRPWKQIVGSE